MATKHKVLKDFQLLTDDKKILILKAKTIIEDYKFKTKTDFVVVSAEIIKNNPEYFSFIDWKEELQGYLKTNKIPQPAVITKKLVPFIETLMSENISPVRETVIEKEVVKEVVIEKPKIVEKEVIVEKIVSDQSLSIELENKIKKLELKEKQLDKEIEETNIKELEFLNKEKAVIEKEKNLNQRETEINSILQSIEQREKNVNEKESYIEYKENNLSAFVARADISAKIGEYEAKGFDMSFFKSIMGEI
jgi:hypothetical protein